MAPLRRYIIVGLFAISGAVMISCGSDNESASGDVGGQGGSNANTVGTGGDGAAGSNSTGTGSAQGGTPASTGDNDQTSTSAGTGGSPVGGNTGGSEPKSTCGNGIVEGDEQCDCGNDGLCTADELKGETCASLEKGSGALGCDINCVLDVSMCIPSEGTDAGTYGNDQTDADTLQNTSGKRAPAVTYSFPMTTESPGVEPYFVVYRPEDMEAAVAETGQPLPVVVWGNGGCLRYSAAWLTLFERWVAGGFVTLGLDVMPDNNPLAMHGVPEHAALIDWVMAENAKDGSPYFGKLDTTQIISAGNSCGGVTALGVAAIDDRVTAVFVLSGSSAIGTTDRNVMGGISVPVGFIEGGVEDISRAAAEADYAALSDGIPAAIVARSSGDHMTISFTDQTIVAQEAEMALNWMDLALYGTQEAYDALTSTSICTGCEPGLYTLTSKNLEKLLQ